MVVARLRPFGESIFATMTELALKHNAINLGQGAPDSSGPPRMLEIAREQIAAGNNQYAPDKGDEVLRQAVARQRGCEVGNVIITVGASEALSASLLGLVEPGSKVIVFEPYFDIYPAAVAMAGSTPFSVPLARSANSWDIDIEAFAAAVDADTAAVIINSPHNPTGSVFSRERLSEFARICCEHDLLVISDEVYENLVFDGAEHVRVAGLPGMWQRTVTVSSAAKSYNATGWKTGWAVGPENLVAGTLAAKQFMTFSGAAPLQPAVAHALDNEGEWLANMVSGLRECRDLLADALRDLNCDVFDTRGTFFLVADISPLGFADGLDFCRQLPQLAGVGAIPVQVFADNPEAWKPYVRFGFCKQRPVIEEAARRLRAFADARV